MDCVLFRKPVYQIILMLIDSAYDVGGHTDIQSSVTPACQNIYVGILYLDRNLSGFLAFLEKARFRGNDVPAENLNHFYQVR
jgi:hypothetical protein